MPQQMCEKIWTLPLSVIIKKKRIEYGDVEVNHDWKIKNLSKYFPKSTKFLDVHDGFDYRFKAKIKELNWD